MDLIDRFISIISPSWAVNRAAARATLSQMEAYGASTKGGYEAGRLSRLTRGSQAGDVKEFAIPQEQIDRLRYSSWNLYRNNPYARKIVRSIESKVVGSGLQPNSVAINDDGTPNTAFRQRAKQLWMSLNNGFDYRGTPGKGGQTLGGMQRLALRSVVLSGETLYRLVPIKPNEQISREIQIPLALQLIDAGRLADDMAFATAGIPDGHSVYRGIELDADGRRVQYWLNTYQPGTLNQTVVEPFSASEIGHLFIEEDIDQLRGTPWFAANLLQMRDTGDLQYNVITSSKMASCVVLGYRKPTGATRFGLNQSSENNSTSADGTDLTDADGNPITKIQPGMFVNLGRDGELSGFAPPQLNMNIEGFIQHMLRGVSAGLPGIKASTVTGDYRNSSFSSEKAADNDTWPEVTALQEWFATSFCHPIYESTLKAGVLSGYFDGIVDAAEFTANPTRYTAAVWQGPVSKSINEVDDINAAGLRMQFGVSSPQRECAKVGVDWREIVNDIAEFYAAAKEAGLPEEVVNNVLSVGSQDVIAQAMQQQANNEEAANVQA